jgi:hypothetical protein
MTFDGKTAVRKVRRSEIGRESEVAPLEHYMAERIPTYYRDPAAIAADLKDGYFLQAVRDTLGRLPTADDFRDPTLPKCSPRSSPSQRWDCACCTASFGS